MFDVIEQGPIENILLIYYDKMKYKNIYISMKVEQVELY